jgi:hypothetical protein
MPKIILKKSSVEGKVPLTSDLEYGELALNYSDGKLYFKNSTNSIDYIGNGGTLTNSVVVTNTTQSTSTTTGALVVSGGVGVGGNLWVGGDNGNIVKTSYETVNKNLRSFPAAFNYSGTNIASIVYTTPSGSITKTFNYTGSTLTSIVLSGDTPQGIALTKTLNYTNELLSSVGYS